MYKRQQEARVLARQGKVAADQFANYTEEQVDRILRNMVKKALDNAVLLAKMAVEETGFGKVEDKVFKNYLGAQFVYNYIKDMKTIGVLSQDTVNKVTSVAEPMGLIMGIVPSTNPTSTTIYKAMIAIKARDAIVFAPHPSAFKCTKMAADILAQAAEEAGAPKNVIQCVELPTMESTNELMHAKEVSMIKMCIRDRRSGDRYGSRRRRRSQGCYRCRRSCSTAHQRTDQCSCHSSSSCRGGVHSSPEAECWRLHRRRQIRIIGVVA